MSIAVLTQVYEEARRLAVAGSALAPGDFRLKKLIPALEKAGAKAPVFGKVAEAAQKLVDSSEKEASQALLDLSTLVSAILYTQGATGAKGKMKAVETVDMGPPVTGTSARVLKPLLEALTNPGSGRLEIIRDAHNRGAFRDIRLVNPTIKAIDDGYGEIGDLIADQILPRFGKTIYPELRAQFDVKGKSGHVRRLRLMNKLDADETQDLVLDALENGSKDMKIGALKCLKGTKLALPNSLEQSAAKNREVREAAYEGMSQLKDKKVVEVFKKALAGKDLKIACYPAAENPSPDLLKFIHETANEQFEAILKEKAKAKQAKLVDQFDMFLRCFTERKDKKTVDFLKKCFDQRDDLMKAKGGEYTMYHLVQLLVLTRSKPILKMLGESHAGLPSEVLRSCFIAAAVTQTPKKLFDEYSPYITTKETKGKKGRRRGDNKWEIVYAVRDLVRRNKNPAAIRSMGMYDFDDDELEDELGMRMTDVAEGLKFDPRWLDAAIESEDLNLIEVLAKPGHKGLNEFLTAECARAMKSRDAYWDVSNVLECMIPAQHPELVDSYVAAVNKLLGKGRKSKYSYGGYWLARLVPDLPFEVIPVLEELVPELSNDGADALVPHIAERKSQKK